MTARSKHSLLSHGVAIFAISYVLIGLGLVFGDKLVTIVGFGFATVAVLMVAIFVMRDDAQ